MLFQSLARPIIFKASAGDPERAHHLVMTSLELASKSKLLLSIIEAAMAYKNPALERTIFGVHFPNPVGLAGGFDKNGTALPALAALGFGFIEAGTVTRYKQPGNDRPRIFRYSESEAIINRMGFPNEGAAAIHARLAKSRPAGVPIGWSLGKSKITPADEAVEDYLYSLRQLDDFSDFFTVNVSSPNTPGLRKLQDKEPLDQLLHAIVQESATLASQQGRAEPKAVLVKIAPDLTPEQVDDIIDVCLTRKVSGIIATNTTLSRDGLQRSTTESGGLSGRPLHARACEMVRYLSQHLEGRLPIIGVGGIFDADDAKRMFDAGASLIQVYTSFIYEGPAIAKQINQQLVLQ